MSAARELAAAARPRRARGSSAARRPSPRAGQEREREPRRRGAERADLRRDARRLAEHRRRVAVARGAPGGDPGLQHELGPHRELVRAPEHGVGEAARAAASRRAAARPCAIAGLIVTFARWRSTRSLSAGPGLARRARASSRSAFWKRAAHDLADPAHALRVGGQHRDHAEVVQDALGGHRRRRAPAAARPRVGRRGRSRSSTWTAATIARCSASADGAERAPSAWSTRRARSARRRARAGRARGRRRRPRCGTRAPCARRTPRACPRPTAPR